MLSKSEKPSAPTATDYVLDERRTHHYSFISMQALQRYFSAWLPDEEIKDRVERARTGFVQRAGCSAEETRLQFLKKCEYSLVRTLRDSSSA
jgi:hypothetical protein